MYTPTHNTHCTWLKKKKKKHLIVMVILSIMYCVENMTRFQSNIWSNLDFITLNQCVILDASLVYVVCLCLCIVMSNTYCVVYLFVYSNVQHILCCVFVCFSSSCVHYVVCFSGLCTLCCLFLRIVLSVFTNVYLQTEIKS